MSKKIVSFTPKKGYQPKCEADAKYQALRMEIKEKIEWLQGHLEDHAEEQSADFRNWGNVGDLGRINELLGEIKEGFTEE